MPMKYNRVKRGFTLIELLVVIAIIAILAAILFPVFQSVRENARVTTGLSNTKQIGLAIMQYVQDNEEYLPLAGHAENDLNPYKAQAEWQNAVYPFVKSDGAYKDPDDNQDTGGAGLPDSAVAAGAGYVGKYGATSFLMSYYETYNPDYAHRRARKLSEFTTPTNFILLRMGQRGQDSGAATGYNVPDHAGNTNTSWLVPYIERAPNDTTNLFNACSETYLSGAGLPYHHRGIIFGFLDGHTKFIPVDMKHPTSYLNGHYPPCQYNRPQGDDPSCTTQGGDPNDPGFNSAWVPDANCDTQF